jgi:hypothetical protein
MRRNLYIAAGALLALVAAFVGGRYSRPARTVETVRVETKIVTQTEWKDRVVEKRVAGPARVRTVTREVPGGERIVERIVERGPVTTERNTDITGTASATTDQASATRRVTEAGRPGWAAGISATTDPRALSSRRLGLELDRRLLGTVWLGLRASAEPDGAEPQVGVAVRLEW